MKFLEKVHGSKWTRLWFACYLIYVVYITSIPAYGGCGNWNDFSPQQTDLFMSLSAVGVGVAFFLTGPLGWGIMAGAVGLGLLGGIEGTARLFMGC